MQVSIWEKETFFEPQDVIIIGSGFVGLWSAFFLKKKNPGLKITILERGVIPTGASTRNAGFACFGSLSEVVHDGKQMGNDRMLELVEMRFRGLERIRKYFKPSLIDFEMSGGYELYDVHDRISSEELKYNIDYINSLIRPVTSAKKTYRLSDENIGKFGFGKTRHLVKNNLEGYLHSGKLLRALLHRVQGMDVQLFNAMEVTSLEKNNQGFEIQTSQGFQFKTEKVLVCTNAFTRNLFPEIDIVPARGQVLLTSPIEGLPFKGSFHSDEGFYYFRNLGKRVLLGGARNKAFVAEETTEMETTDYIQFELERYLADTILPNFKDRYTIDHRWAGIMAMGSEKMPIVKELEPGVFSAVRMSGMGVALAPVAGQTVARMMYD
jgi:gamma-glutamylputrescine oxidase